MWSGRGHASRCALPDGCDGARADPHVLLHVLHANLGVALPHQRRDGGGATPQNWRGLVVFSQSLAKSLPTGSSGWRFAIPLKRNTLSRGVARSVARPLLPEVRSTALLVLHLPVPHPLQRERLPHPRHCHHHRRPVVEGLHPVCLPCLLHVQERALALTSSAVDETDGGDEQPVHVE